MRKFKCKIGLKNINCIAKNHQFHLVLASQGFSMQLYFLIISLYMERLTSGWTNKQWAAKCHYVGPNNVEPFVDKNFITKSEKDINMKILEKCLTSNFPENCSVKLRKWSVHYFVAFPCPRYCKFVFLGFICGWSKVYILKWE